MSATKTVGFVVLIGVGIYAVYYFMTKKIGAAESAANEKIDKISAGLSSGVAGVVASLGAGLKGLTGGLTKAGTAAGAVTAAGSAASFVGPLQPTAAAAGTGLTVGSLGTVGIVGAIATAGLFIYSAFHRIFPSKDPEWEAIERRLQEAKTRGELILGKVSKSQLKAPVR